MENNLPLTAPCPQTGASSRKALSAPRHRHSWAHLRSDVGASTIAGSAGCSRTRGAHSQTAAIEIPSSMDELHSLHTPLWTNSGATSPCQGIRRYPHKRRKNRSGQWDCSYECASSGSMSNDQTAWRRCGFRRMRFAFHPARDFVKRRRYGG
jgi:hypothetical protein